MSNAPHTKAPVSRLSLVRDREAAVDAKIGASKTERAFGRACPECLAGSGLFPEKRTHDADCEIGQAEIAAALKVVERAGYVTTRDAVAPGSGWFDGAAYFMSCKGCQSIVSFARKTIAPDVFTCADCVAVESAAARAKCAAKESRFVEEAIPCPGGGHCTFCGGSGKHWAVREVESVGPVVVTETALCPPPSTQREDGLCPNEACRQWIGTRAKSHDGPDSCGWKAQS